MSPVSFTEKITLDGISGIESMMDMIDADVGNVTGSIDSDVWYTSDANGEEYSRKEFAFADDNVDIIVAESVSLSVSDFDTAEIEEFNPDKVCISSIVNLVNVIDGDISCEDKCDDMIESSEEVSNMEVK